VQNNLAFIDLYFHVFLQSLLPRKLTTLTPCPAPRCSCRQSFLADR